MNDPIFANGFLFKRNEKAPDFVVGNMSIKVDEAKEFLDQHIKNGWVNCSIKQSKAGKYYIELDTWEPKSDQGNTDAPLPPADAFKAAPEQQEEEQPDLPF